MFRERVVVLLLHSIMRYAIELCFCMMHSVGGDCCEQVVIPLVVLFLRGVVRCLR